MLFHINHAASFAAAEFLIKKDEHPSADESARIKLFTRQMD
jgi:hypothetical protein